MSKATSWAMREFCNLADLDEQARAWVLWKIHDDFEMGGLREACNNFRGENFPKAMHTPGKSI